MWFKDIYMVVSTFYVKIIYPFIGMAYFLNKLTMRQYHLTKMMEIYLRVVTLTSLKFVDFKRNVSEIPLFRPSAFVVQIPPNTATRQNSPVYSSCLSSYNVTHYVFHRYNLSCYLAKILAVE